MKYSNNIKIKNQNLTFTNHRNRGANLEEDINMSNEYYKIINRAIIYKKPTPIQPTLIHYNQDKKKIISKAYFKVPSTTDYNGIYREKYIDFEAKETKNKNFYPVRNIHKHQIEHIDSIIKHGGIAFFIIRFSCLSKTYLVKGEDFISYINNKKSTIPISFFIDTAYEIEESYNPRLKYLDTIDKIYFGGAFNATTNQKN